MSSETHFHMCVSTYPRVRRCIRQMDASTVARSGLFAARRGDAASPFNFSGEDVGEGGEGGASAQGQPDGRAAHGLPMARAERLRRQQPSRDAASRAARAAPLHRRGGAIRQRGRATGRSQQTHMRCAWQRVGLRVLR